MICSLQGNAESLSSFIHNKVRLTDWFGFNSTIPLPISLASISSVLTRECYYFQYVFRTCKKIIVNLDANRTLVKTCLELKGFSSNRFGKIMASVPTRMYICLFKHCLLNGGKWSSDLWPLVEDCWKQLGLVLCNLHLLSPFETGTKTKATKKNCFGLSLLFWYLSEHFMPHLPSNLLHYSYIFGLHFHCLNFWWVKVLALLGTLKKLAKCLHKGHLNILTELPRGFLGMSAYCRGSPLLLNSLLWWPA